MNGAPDPKAKVAGPTEEHYGNGSSDLGGGLSGSPCPPGAHSNAWFKSPLGDLRGLLIEFGSETRDGLFSDPSEWVGNLVSGW